MIKSFPLLFSCLQNMLHFWICSLWGCLYTSQLKNKMEIIQYIFPPWFVFQYLQDCANHLSTYFSFAVGTPLFLLNIFYFPSPDLNSILQSAVSIHWSYLFIPFWELAPFLFVPIYISFLGGQTFLATSIVLLHTHLWGLAHLQLSRYTAVSLSTESLSAIWNII